MTAVFPFFNFNSVQRVQQAHTEACPGVAHFLLAEFLLGKILGIERRKTCTSHLIVELRPMATHQISGTNAGRTLGHPAQGEFELDDVCPVLDRRFSQVR